MNTQHDQALLDWMHRNLVTLLSVLSEEQRDEDVRSELYFSLLETIPGPRRSQALMEVLGDELEEELREEEDLRVSPVQDGTGGLVREEGDTTAQLPLPGMRWGDEEEGLT